MLKLSNSAISWGIATKINFRSKKPHLQFVALLIHQIKYYFTFCVVVSFLSTTTLVGSNMRTFMDNHLDDIHRGCVSGMRGNGGLTTVHPALWNSSIWWQGRSGLDRTNPGPMMLKVASICIGLGSSKDNLCTRYPRSPRCRLIHSMPRLFVTCCKIRGGRLFIEQNTKSSLSNGESCFSSCYDCE